MDTTLAATTQIAAEQRRRAAAARLYDAEFALHAAHQTHVDAWIKAASDRLHQAVAAHLGALADAWPDGEAGSAPTELCNRPMTGALR